ncbi:MAG TPA: hypothetical protein VFT64_02555 [Rickettsiales bacterium]|nr:hypothetical protein [Rickettsiales bacterium]
MALNYLQTAQEFDRFVGRFNSIDSLSQEVKELSIEHARNILKHLRIVANGENKTEKRDVDEDAREIADAMLEAAKMFAALVMELVKDGIDPLKDQEIAPLFEATRDAFGKAKRRVRVDIINMLSKMGRAGEALQMKQQLEAESRQTAQPTTVSSMADVARQIEERLAKLEAAARKKQMQAKLGGAKGKLAAAVMNVSNNVGGVFRIVGLNKEGFLPAAQHTNEILETTMVGKSVAEVSHEKLVDAAQKASEGPEITFGQNRTDNKGKA